MGNSMSIASVVGATSAGIVGIATSIWFYQCVKKWGVQGTLNYIWDGNPLPPAIRSAMRRLATAESSLGKKGSLLEMLEESLARGRLNSVDESDEVPAWVAAHAPADVEKDLAQASHALDGIAAKVDAISSSHDEVRRLKKELSQRIVGLMARTDALLGVYKKQDSPA